MVSLGDMFVTKSYVKGKKMARGGIGGASGNRMNSRGSAAGHAVSGGGRSQKGKSGDKLKRGGKSTTSNSIAKYGVKSGQLSKKFSPTNSAKMYPAPIKYGKR